VLLMVHKGISTVLETGYHNPSDKFMEISFT
jgi:hypothetical protein